MGERGRLGGRTNKARITTILMKITTKKLKAKQWLAQEVGVKGSKE